MLDILIYKAENEKLYIFKSPRSTSYIREFIEDHPEYKITIKDVDYKFKEQLMVFQCDLNNSEFHYDSRDHLVLYISNDSEIEMFGIRDDEVDKFLNSGYRKWIKDEVIEESDKYKIRYTSKNKKLSEKAEKVYDFIKLQEKFGLNIYGMKNTPLKYEIDNKIIDPDSKDMVILVLQKLMKVLIEDTDNYYKTREEAIKILSKIGGK